MTLVIPDGYGSAAFVFTGAVGTQPYVTTLGVDIGDDGGDHVDTANVLFNAWDLTMKAETSNALTLDRVTLSIGASGPSGSVDSTTAPQTQGRSGTFGPTAISAIARKSTNVLGRRGRGRMFLPGAVNEAEVGPDGQIIGARRTTLSAALNNFLVILQNGNSGLSTLLPPVLLHSDPALAPTLITGFGVSSIVGLVRGRIR